MHFLLYLCTLFLTRTNKTVKLLTNLLIKNNNIMKKIFTVIAAALLIATSASAQHEIGAIVGGLNGASYKYWFNDNMAIQADLAVGLTEAAGGNSYAGSYYSWHAGMWDFTINPNFLYHFQLPANFKVYCGGGVNFGMLGALATSGGGVDGKFGINAVGGVSYDLDAAPIVLAFDFRPGYGLDWVPNGHMSYFDWKLALAVRYKF